MRKKLIIWSILAVISVLLYLVVWMVSLKDTIQQNLSDPARAELFIEVILKIFERRTFQVIALVLSSVLIASSTLVFQTLTSNRIITPSLLGFDSIYVMLQTTLIYFLNQVSFIALNPVLNFILSVSLMCGVTIFLYKAVLRKHRNNILLLLLIGMVISTLASNYSQFLQILLDPTQFQMLQSLTTVSVVNIEQRLTLISIPVGIVVVAYFMYHRRMLDVMSLGEDKAVNLGVDYNRKTYLNLIMISLAISLVTALVGPLAFLGIIAVNIAKEIYKTYHHGVLIIGSSLIAIVALIFGQSIVELLGFKTTVTTFMSIVGGIYMIYLVIMEHKV